MKRFLCILGFVAVVTMAAGSALAATEWNFGASLRFATWWTALDAGKGQISDMQSGGAKLSNDASLEFLQQRNSRIKMFMKSDRMEGYIEMGWNVDSSTVTPREYRGTFKFNDSFSITIGQTHSLFNTIGFSNQSWANDVNMRGVGVAWNAPDNRITLKYQGFQFSLSTPYHTEGKFSGTISSTTAYTADKDTYIPQLQFGYMHSGEDWRLKVVGAFQTYELKHLRAAGSSTDIFKNKNVNSWMLMADGNLNFGPLYLAATASVGQNWSEARWNSSKGGLANDYANNKRLNTFAVALKGNKLKDTSSLMGAVIVGYRLTEALRLEAGFGYRYDENDAWDKNSHMWLTYIQASYTVAKGFRIVPEMGLLDLGKTVGTRGANDARDNGYVWYVGAKWQMDF